MTLRLDAEFWNARMTYLAKVARADAIAVILQMKGEGYVTYVAHNLPTDTRWSEGLPSVMLAKAMSERATDQATSGVTLTLSDGRAADTLAVSPVIWKDQVVGGLAAVLAGRAFSAEDLSSLSRVGDLIGLELAEANALWRAQRQGQDAEAKLKASRDLQAIIRKERDPDQLLERATAQLADVFGADGVSIMLADAHGELSVRSSRGLSDVAKLDRKRIGEGISGTVAQTGRSMLLSGQVQGGSDPTASESMIAPLRSNGRTLGVVSVKHRAQQERYGQMQVDSLTQAAAEIASALVTAEEFQRAEEDRRQALVLYELSRFATLGIDPHNDLESAVAMLADNLRHDAVGVWAAEEHHLHLRAATGYGDITPADISTSGTDTVLAQVLRERRTATAQYGMAEDRPDWAAPSSTHFLLAPIGGSQTGVVLGVLVLGRATTPYTSAEADFVATLGEYLSGMLQKSASTDLVQRTASNERRRISQELHDGVAQELTGVVLALEGCQRALDRDPSVLGPQLAKAARDARATLSDVRQYMAALRQTEESGGLNLPVTVARLADDLRRQSGLAVDFEETGAERPLEPFVERAVIRIIGEGLRNVGQHSGASNAKVILRYDDEQVVATIEDDGKGFESNELNTAEERGHYGIVGMRERAEGVGGQLVVRSEPGRGTIVRATIPYRLAVDGTPPGWTDTVEDTEQRGAIEDLERTEKASFLGRLFGR
ncbi:MAG: GAF domain-containing sensor histidine kinase [Chloroflexi bacterium]|nr:MAG: GAF domain-containing sensor histidine kinase [Chloroflexota bacterium]TMG63009.1 MAG: GAF domain-containing sensor histidine kinase [Chloroflexota bacterium]